MKIVLITGGFDPLHSGHIAYIKAARELGAQLIVGINSDEWLARKKSQSFMNWEERATIVAALHYVDRVISFDDSDDSAIDAIRKIKEIYKNHEIVFANGGDRTEDNIPEMIVDGVEFVFGVGGYNKKNSSSQLLNNWKNPKTIRPWGWYRVLEDQVTYKVKELVIEPGKSLSMQKHMKRSEHWHVLKGECQIKTSYNNLEAELLLLTNCTYIVGPNVWHQGINSSHEACHILEIQYGEICVENDIERL